MLMKTGSTGAGAGANSCFKSASQPSHFLCLWFTMRCTMSMVGIATHFLGIFTVCKFTLLSSVFLFLIMKSSRGERTVKFFSPSLILICKIESDPVLICKIFENHQSDLVLIRPCQAMYFILLHEAKQTQPFGNSKI